MCVYTRVKIILSDFSSHWSFSLVYESEVLFVILTLHSMAQTLLAPFRKEEQELSGCYTRNWHSDLATGQLDSARACVCIAKLFVCSVQPLLSPCCMLRSLTLEKS